MLLLIHLSDHLLRFASAPLRRAISEVQPCSGLISIARFPPAMLPGVSLHRRARVAIAGFVRPAALAVAEASGFPRAVVRLDALRRFRFRQRRQASRQ